ncbi:uncharacterized protein LOC116198534 [Punica granatum]|uniref:Protein preY, mitochondrial n=2 Tax=Punica granatum TaxID=22663 RepID=A0A218W0W5_PUNGR|nr:uncharacterized protein LOC116198534 [Punica granatum]OWM66464.1 hypothetical protein CDL15_Pgr013681 [Punica granatum]PKI59905.1 hypothetical protein CRG98_019678 [Punica granatum]
MVRGSVQILRDAAINGLSRTLSDILVCPLSKQPLRVCDKTGSLISDTIGVSFPINDGIPCLVPKDGKILGDGDHYGAPNSGPVNDSTPTNKG